MLEQIQIRNYVVSNKLFSMLNSKHFPKLLFRVLDVSQSSASANSSSVQGRLRRQVVRTPIALQQMPGTQSPEHLMKYNQSKTSETCRLVAMM